MLMGGHQTLYQVNCLLIIFRSTEFGCHAETMCYSIFILEKTHRKKFL